MTSHPVGAAEFQNLAGMNQAQMVDMEGFRALLLEWSGRINLIGPSAMESFWLRHAWDSAQLLRRAPEAKIWADVGAGAGFPGIVLAIGLKETPDARVHLIESMAKRCRFLSEVVKKLSLPAIVHHGRAEDTRLKGVEVVTARACAPVKRLLHFTEPLMKDGAVGLFLKGKDVENELAEAHELWRFKSELSPSLSGGLGHILKVEALSRAS